jgi:DNA processing protein
MTLATVLMEAPVDSGAMITMQKAFTQKRKLFAIPGQLDFPSFEGNHRLIKTGEAQLIENGQDVSAHFQDLLGSYKKEVLRRERPTLEQEEEKLLECIPARELSFDEIAGITKYSTIKLNVILMGLVLKRAINEYPGKIYKKVF